MSLSRDTTSAGIAPPKMLLQLDMFGASLPEFNSRGKSRIETYFGGCVSLIVNCLLFMFAASRF